MLKPQSRQRRPPLQKTNKRRQCKAPMNDERLSPLTFAGVRPNFPTF
jgi:hypothetical protein